MRSFLHVGCGPKHKDRTTKAFAAQDWQEIRFDIDPKAKPDLVGTMTDMSVVQTCSIQAVYSSHNIEHLYPHEVPVALSEFHRVLTEDGFAVITCPDLKSVCALVAQDKLVDPAYTVAAGPIAPIDIVARPNGSRQFIYGAQVRFYPQDIALIARSGWVSILRWYGKRASTLF